QRYNEPLLRRVAARLLKPRNEWPTEELIERCLAATENTPLVDRRLQELDAASQRVVAAIGFSRQARWRLGRLVELAVALGAADGLQPVLELLEGGFLYPLTNSRVTGFAAWIGQTAGTAWVFAPPVMAGRARGEQFTFADAPHGVPASGPVLE